MDNARRAQAWDDWAMHDSLNEEPPPRRRRLLVQTFVDSLHRTRPSNSHEVPLPGQGRVSIQVFLDDAADVESEAPTVQMGVHQDQEPTGNMWPAGALQTSQFGTDGEGVVSLQLEGESGTGDSANTMAREAQSTVNGPKGIDNEGVE